MTQVMIKQISPLAGYVVVEPVELQTKTDSGIYLPGSNEEKPQMGTVVAISAKHITENGTEVKCPVKVGDTVLYKKWGGNEVKAEGKEVQVLKYDDMIAVITK